MSTVTRGLTAALVVALCSTSAIPVAAQTVALNACYVPGVGALYMIKQQGLPQSCLASSHAEVSWTDGGAGLVDGSVVTVKLADRAVTTTKLEDLAVTVAKLAAASVTSEKIADGAVNASKIADGAVGGTKIGALAVNTGHLVNAAVTRDKIANGAVTTDKLAVRPTVFSTVRELMSVNQSDVVVNVLSLPVTAPTNGTMLLMVTGHVVTFGQGTQITIGIGTTNALMDLTNVDAGAIDGTDNLRREFPFAAIIPVAVTAGSRTFFVNARRPGVFDAHNVNVANARLTAVFIPN